MACASARLLEMAIQFASPRRLNLRLLCPRRIRVRELLGVWPAFPIAIWDSVDFTPEDDSVIAAFEQHDRVVKSGSSVSQDRNRKNWFLLCRSHSLHSQHFTSFRTGAMFGISFIPSLTDSASVCK